MDVTPSQEAFLASPMFRRLLLFVVFFMATRDIAVSVTLTLGYIVIVGNFLNEQSPYCLIPQKYAKSDIQRPKPDEIEAAKKVLRAAEIAENRDATVQRVSALETLERNRTRRSLFQA